MESFTIELVSNESEQLFHVNTLSSFTNFLPEQLNLEGQWRLQFRKYPTHHCKKMSGRENLFFDKKLSKWPEFYYLEPGFYHSIMNIVEVTNSLIQEKHNHSERCITVEVSRRTQKVEIYLANEGTGLEFVSTDLGHSFGSDFSKEFGVMLRGEGHLTNQKMLTTLYAYTLSCYTQT